MNLKNNYAGLLRGRYDIYYIITGDNLATGFYPRHARKQFYRHRV